ncbi:UNVERIFIED_CONTAM: hypothetical protein RMT77_010554 [Armadillidium vulgare]
MFISYNKLNEEHKGKPIFWTILKVLVIFVSVFTTFVLFQTYAKIFYDDTPTQNSKIDNYRKLIDALSQNNSLTSEFLAQYVSLSSDSDISVILDKDHESVPRVKSRVNHCDNVPINFRFDCLPSGEMSPFLCAARGCCWKEVSPDEIPPKKNMYSRLRPNYKSEFNETEAPLNVPYCFYPSDYSIYDLKVNYKEHGFDGVYTRHSDSGFPKDINKLKLEVIYETCSRVRIRIFDYSKRRWETPLPAVPQKFPGCNGKKLYNVFTEEGNIIVSREDNQEPLFDMRKAASLIFSDQYIQISTLLPSPYIYGLGQHLDGLLLDTYWNRRVLWNADMEPNTKWNLYGSHPFYMVMEDTGSSHGVFLLNSNAMEVILQPTPALTFRTLGGIIDLYVFLGPTPDNVISQYTEVIGRPLLPPYWSLGYHQCRFGYNSLENMKKVWNRTREAGIPFDVQWNDIDYMKDRNDFTINEENFKDLPSFVHELHSKGMHYVIMTDPGISGSEEPGGYLPYDLGVKEDVFVKNSTDQIFIGKVWNNKSTVFPDFFKPNSVIYWSSLIRKFHERLAFDGLWIDMNEPSNFYNGQKDGCPVNSSLEHPYYIPLVKGGVLYFKTLCMTAKHHLGNHYDLHNIYGFSEAIATFASLKIVKKNPDPFIISRATFPGIGAFAGHWTGDIYSDWFNLWKSIGDVLTMNIHGIPMVGADICGFNGNTTVPLCNRWMQLGAFYPFSRNHNTDDGIDQDPVAMGELVVKSSRKALLQRYTLLPFLYSLFVKAHLTGVPVAKPLFFKYPRDRETYSIDTQFMWGNELMIIPVLEEDVTEVEAYFPKGKWYDWYTGKMISKYGGEYLTLSSPLDTIRLALAEGSILPCQNPEATTTFSRLNPFGLVAALNSDRSAVGELHWNRPYDREYVHWKFRSIPNYLYAEPSKHLESSTLILQWVRIFGVPTNVYVVKVNDVSVDYTYNAVTQVLQIYNLSVDFTKAVTIYYV